MRRRMTDRLNLDVQEGLSGIRADAYLLHKSFMNFPVPRCKS